VVANWLLVSTEPLAGGRSKLTFLLAGGVYRIASVWGDPPDERTVRAAGDLLAGEQQARPVGGRYQLSNEAPPPEPPEAA
jgi:hypothetical protein